MKVYFDNHVYQLLRWKTVQYINLLAHLDTNKECPKLYTLVVNMKSSTEVAVNSDGGVCLIF